MLTGVMIVMSTALFLQDEKTLDLGDGFAMVTNEKGGEPPVVKDKDDKTVPIIASSPDGKAHILKVGGASLTATITVTERDDGDDSDIDESGAFVSKKKKDSYVVVTNKNNDTVKVLPSGTSLQLEEGDKVTVVYDVFSESPTKTSYDPYIPSAETPATDGGLPQGLSFGLGAFTTGFMGIRLEVSYANTFGGYDLDGVESEFTVGAITESFDIDYEIDIDSKFEFGLKYELGHHFRFGLKYTRWEGDADGVVNEAFVDLGDGMPFPNPVAIGLELRQDFEANEYSFTIDYLPLLYRTDNWKFAAGIGLTLGALDWEIDDFSADVGGPQPTEFEADETEFYWSGKLILEAGYIFDRWTIGAHGSLGLGGGRDLDPAGEFSVGLDFGFSF